MQSCSRAPKTRELRLGDKGDAPVGWSLWDVLAVRDLGLWGAWEGNRGRGEPGAHLVATSNLSLTVVTLQPLAPCCFRSNSQSSGVSKRGTGGFFDSEPWPGAGVRCQGSSKKMKEGFSAHVSSTSLCLLPPPTTELPLEHPHSQALRSVIPKHCWP